MFSGFYKDRPLQLLLLLLLRFILIQVYISTIVSSESHTRLTSNVALERPVPEGTEVTLTCSTDSSTGSGVLRILRRRGGGGGIDGFEDLANFAIRIVQVSADRPDIAATFVVSRKDDGAVFICGDVETLGFQSQTPAPSRTIRVQYDPRSLSLRSVPEGGMREDMSKVIICQTDEGGANPAVNITWRHLTPLGAVEALGEEMHTTTSHRRSANSDGAGFVTQSNLTVLAHRRLNGHRIECSVEKPGRIALLRQSETLEVIFAPNNVQIHPGTTGGVLEGEVISLTCAVTVSHPPATVRWFEFPPGSGGAADSGREITDLAQIDMTPGEYGGMLVDSTLRISKTFRSNSQTVYRCTVNQAALNNPVVAEYTLNVLYPPTIEIVSLPNDPTEGQSVTLSCLTHGGMPDKGFTFSWWHCQDPHLLFTPSHNGQQSLSPVLAKSLVASLNASHLSDLFSTRMTQMPSHTGRHLMLDAVAFEQSGWYGCQVANGGGTAQSLHLLLISCELLSHVQKYRRLHHNGIIFRICLPSRTSTNSASAAARSVRPSGELVFLRPIKEPSANPSTSSATVDVASASAAGSSDECGDYEVTFAELGFLQVELDRPIVEYTFQFLVYQDAKLQQITRPVRWTADNQIQTSASSKLLVQLIIGILITLLVVCLFAFIIYYFCTCLKRKNMKKLAPATSNGLLHGARTYQTLESGKPFTSPPSGAGSISADIGLLHPAYARQSIASSCQSAKGFYSPQPPGHMANSAHPLLENTYSAMQNAELRGSPSNASHVSALTQRILSEVYIAAAKAASIAVSESLASGSMDAMNQTIGGPGNYRPGSHYAESASMMGGSISALDGLGGYPGTTPNGVSRMRKSPNARTTTPTYQGHLTPQPVPSTPHFMGQQILRPRIPSQPGPAYGWTSPLLTTQATMRLNEAANALAAAAAAAVLEATGATPDLGVQGSGSHASRFSGSAGGGGGGGTGGLGTSSEDGESISSNSFFPRNSGGKAASQETTAKKKKLVQGSHKGSPSNTGNESLLPMLAIQPNIASNYPQIVDPRGARTSTSEFTAYLPSAPIEGLWTQNFQLIPSPRTGEESKLSPYSDARSEANSNASATNAVCTFTNSPTPTVARRLPVVNPQPPSSSASYTTDDGNPNDNTLRANTDMQSIKLPPRSGHKPMSPSQTVDETQQ